MPESATVGFHETDPEDDLGIENEIRYFKIANITISLGAAVVEQLRYGPIDHALGNVSMYGITTTEYHHAQFISPTIRRAGTSYLLKEIVSDDSIEFDVLGVSSNYVSIRVTRPIPEVEETGRWYLILDEGLYAWEQVTEVPAPPTGSGQHRLIADTDGVLSWVEDPDP